MGLCTPKSSVLSYTDELKSVHFPCIVKPLTSVNTSKDEIKVCHNIEQLKASLKQSNGYYQVQDFIDKTMEFQLIGVRIGKEVIIPGFTDIIRQPENTNTGYLRYAPYDNNFVSKEILKNYLTELGYQGLFSIEFIKKDKYSYFMEINMRNDGNAYVVTKAGVNLPYIWYCYCVNKNSLALEQKCFEKPIFFMPELQDFKNIGKIGPLKWFIQFMRAEAHSIWNIQDPLPFIYYILYKILKQ